MPEFFFTFGFSQEHAPGYARIEATDMIDAREIMFEKHGRKWAFGYESLDDLHELDKIERFSYKSVEILAGDEKNTVSRKSWRSESWGR